MMPWSLRHCGDCVDGAATVETRETIGAEASKSSVGGDRGTGTDSQPEGDQGLQGTPSQTCNPTQSGADHC